MATQNKVQKSSDGTSVTHLADSTIYDDGTNVAIGSTSPGGKLDIETAATGDSRMLCLRVPNATGNNSMLNFAVGSGGSSTDIARIKTEYSAASKVGLSIHTYNSGLSERVRIDPSGLVGIGTATPSALLDIQGTAVSSLPLLNVNVTSGTATAILGTAATGYGIQGTSNSGTGILGTAYNAGTGGAFYSDSSSGIALHTATGRVQLDGNVGIGTAAPAQKLDVNGNGRFRSVGTASGTLLYITASGDLSTSSSDRRKKKDITVLKNVLEKVTKLRGVNFKWRDPNEKGMQIGMIAQEVEEVYPELVFTNHAEGFKGIRYAEVSAVLVEAIKELQARIEKLEKKSSKKKSTR